MEQTGLIQMAGAKLKEKTTSGMLVRCLATTDSQKSFTVPWHKVSGTLVEE